MLSCSAGPTSEFSGIPFQFQEGFLCPHSPALQKRALPFLSGAGQRVTDLVPAVNQPPSMPFSICYCEFQRTEGFPLSLQMRREGFSAQSHPPMTPRTVTAWVTARADTDSFQAAERRQKPPRRRELCGGKQLAAYETMVPLFLIR